MSTSPLIQQFRDAGQGQVLAFFDRLSPSEQEHLLSQAEEIDLDEIARLKSTLIDKGASAGVDLQGLVPAPYEKRPEHGGDAAAWQEARRVGEEALRAGRVAAFTVAGGQGTRLGFEGPKGTFPVTPVKHKTLFQVFAEKIRAVGEQYGKPLHWFIMTSHQNHEATEKFFQEHNYFGLSPERVHLFRQGRMPAVDFDGKILLESPSSIALSPDGHGGSLRALERSGSLDLMEREGIDTISYFQVDNPLVQCVDAEFVGWHILRGSEMSSKMLPKAYAEEKLGHFCLQNGNLVVVEYSDLPMEMQRETDEAGQLRFNAGSIAIHVLDRDFVRRMSRRDDSGEAAGDSPLPFHRADKKIPTVDEGGNAVKPDAPNGIKFEMFVFDALPFARNPLVIETSRENEFAPVKNAEGLDSPQTSREAQVKLFASWVKSEGGEVPAVTFEVSPLFGYDQTSFSNSWRALPSKPEIGEGTYLEPKS
jgi:UDP-N-acetylglucosamine/UDP-N-acetylgalactosamine diphosphorylase